MEKLAAWVWGPQTMGLMLGVGLLMTIRSGGIQFRRWKETAAVLRKPAGNAGVSPFQAVCTALAGSVGTGNIAGVAGAVALGGPGAVFWMWVSALLGMATKYAEVVLALRYRQKNEQGQWQGGPMYYITHGMGRRWRWMAGVFALFAVGGSLAMGNVAQVHTIAGSIQTAMTQWMPQWSGRTATIMTGVAAAVFVTIITVGGVERIGSVMGKLMPFLSAVYLLGGLAVLLVHAERIPSAFIQILQGAFSLRGAVGGAAGLGIRQAMRWGISRGVFSNEAGLGSAPMAHAAAKAVPEEQGLMGIFEVFFDTIVLCTLTALVILVSGVPIAYGEAAGAELATAALETVFGKSAGIMQAVVLAFLALGSMVSWNYYGSCCAAYLWGRPGQTVYQMVYPVVTLVGATMGLSAVWTVSDLCNGLMALPNLLALIALRKQIKP